MRASRGIRRGAGPRSGAALALLSLLAGTGRARADDASAPGLVMVLEARGALARDAAAQHALAELRRALDEGGVAAPPATELGALREARVDPAWQAGATALRLQAEENFRRLDNRAAGSRLEEARVLHLRRFSDVFGDPEAARAALLAASVERAEAHTPHALGRNAPPRHPSARMREALQRAIEFDPADRLDPGQYPPEIVEAYTIERQYLVASGVPYPSATRLCEAGRLLGARRIVVPVPNATTTQDSLGLDVYEPESCSRRFVSLSMRQDVDDVRRAARGVLGLDPAGAAVTLVRPGGTPGRPRAPASRVTPWYARWYTIAGAGAVIVGSLAAGILLAPGNPDGHTEVSR